MRKIAQIGLIALALIFVFNIDATAQRRGSKDRTKKEETSKETTTEDANTTPSDDTKPTATKSKVSKSKTDNYFDESGGFKHRIQYGFHTNAGILSFFGGNFNLRLQPSVGYKITNWAMAGLTGGVDYYRQKDQTQVLTAPIFAYGVYARLKALKSIYVHADYQGLSGKFTTKLIGTDTKISLKDSYKPEMNVGIAYRSGFSSWAYEIMGTYNVAHVDGNFGVLSNKTYSFRESPVDLKIGFTYNF
jgi:hypothetical protein